MTAPDPTGLVPAGRAKDGRYLYHSVSVLGARNLVRLTQDQRVGLAVVRAVARLARPGTIVYPMTRQTGTRGYGAFCGCRVWLARPLLSGADPSRAMDTLAHEMGHNGQPPGSRPHGPEFRRVEAEAMAALRRVTSDFTRWPKVDLRQLRDSKPPEQRRRERVAARRASKAAETPVLRWTRELAHARGMQAQHEAAALKAERLAAKWTKKAKHAARWLDAARERETR